jgi:hypothetical protein
MDARNSKKTNEQMRRDVINLDPNENYNNTSYEMIQYITFFG